MSPETKLTPGSQAPSLEVQRHHYHRHRHHRRRRPWPDVWSERITAIMSRNRALLMALLAAAGLLALLLWLFQLADQAAIQQYAGRDVSP